MRRVCQAAFFNILNINFSQNYLVLPLAQNNDCESKFSFREYFFKVMVQPVSTETGISLVSSYTVVM
jgi:hypothetical protein